MRYLQKTQQIQIQKKFKTNIASIMPTEYLENQIFRQIFFMPNFFYAMKFFLSPWRKKRLRCIHFLYSHLPWLNAMNWISVPNHRLLPTGHSRKLGFFCHIKVPRLKYSTNIKNLDSSSKHSGAKYYIRPFGNGFYVFYDIVWDI